MSATWEVVDEQPVEDYLLAHERFDMQREGSITGFVPRGEVELLLAAVNRIEGSSRIESVNRKHLRRAYKRRTR